MSISRKVGIIIFAGVPAIIGGGIIYHFFGSFVSLVIYEILLYFFVGAIVTK